MHRTPSKIFWCRIKPLKLMPVAPHPFARQISQFYQNFHFSAAFSHGFDWTSSFQPPRRSLEAPLPFPRTLSAHPRRRPPLEAARVSRARNPAISGVAPGRYGPIWADMGRYRPIWASRGGPSLGSKPNRTWREAPLGELLGELSDAPLKLSEPSLLPKSRLPLSQKQTEPGS